MIAHLTNRGVAQRPLFETARDARNFLARVAWAVRCGWIVVYAICVMTNHFHIVAFSPTGMLSKAMQWICGGYALFFNRSRERSGPVFDGRFDSREVDDDAYLVTVIRYVEENPVRAGMVKAPWHYPFGSAFRYFRGAPPRWLDSSLVESLVSGRDVGGQISPEAYARFLSVGSPDWRAEFVEKNLQLPDAEGLPLRALLTATTGEVRDWLRERAELADGRGARFSVFLASPKTLREEIARVTGCPPDVGLRKVPMELRAMTAGLLASGAGMTLEQVAAVAGGSYSSVRNWVGRHRERMEKDPAYAATCARVVQSALRREFGSENLLIGV
ncbi:MAG: transposase [Planctomycetota bacterium]